MANVLVLGGGGFIGSHLIKALSKGNHRTTSVSRSSGTDITRYAQLKRAIQERNPDVIINCAAHVGGITYVSSHSADILRDNVSMGINLYQAVKEINPAIKIIQPLSNCSYPGDANHHYEPDWFNGQVHDSIFGYGFSRKMLWGLSYTYHQQYGIKTVNWITPNGYGPGDHTDPARTHALNGIIIRLILAQRQKEKEFTIWGSGKPTREWGYAPDVARILAYSVQHIDEQISPINFAQNKAYSIRNIAAIAAQHLNYKVKFTFDTTKPDGAPFKILDNRIFRSKYPTFSFTPLEDGIKKTIQFYKKVL